MRRHLLKIALSPGQTIAIIQRTIVGLCLATLLLLLKMIKLEFTDRPNAIRMLRRTMLRYFVLKCCDRLAGALIWTDAPSEENLC